MEEKTEQYEKGNQPSKRGESDVLHRMEHIHPQKIQVSTTKHLPFPRDAQRDDMKHHLTPGQGFPRKEWLGAYTEEQSIDDVNLLNNVSRRATLSRSQADPVLFLITKRVREPGIMSNCKIREAIQCRREWLLQHFAESIPKRLWQWGRGCPGSTSITAIRVKLKV